LDRVELVKIFSISLTLALVGLFLYLNGQDLLTVRVTNWAVLASSPLYLFLFFYFNGVLNNICFRFYGVNLTFQEWFGLSVVNSFLNIVTPFRGGAIAVGVYLKKKHNFAYSLFFAVMVASTLLIVLANLILALGLLIMQPPALSAELTEFSLYVVISLLAIGLIFAVWAPVTPRSTNRLFQLVHEVFSAWRMIRNHPHDLKKLIGASFGMVLTMAAIAYVTISSIGVDVNFNAALAMGVFSNLSAIVSITPSNLGIKEAFASIGGAGYGIKVVNVVAASLIERVLLLIASSLTSLYFYRALFAKNNISTNATEGVTSDRP